MIQQKDQLEGKKTTDKMKFSLEEWLYVCSI